MDTPKVSTPQEMMRCIQEYVRALIQFIVDLFSRFWRRPSPLPLNIAEGAPERKTLGEIWRILNSLNQHIIQIMQVITAYQERLSEREAHQFKRISDALSKHHLPHVVSADEFERQLSLRTGRETVEEISQALVAWKAGLDVQHEHVLRLQRYVATTAARYPKLPESELFTKLSEEDIREVKRLNKEIIACEMLLGRSRVESLPINVQIEPTNRCNARCKTCAHRSVTGWSYHDAELEELALLGPVITFSNFVEIFGHGEPSLAPTFEHIVRICNQGGSESRTLTNGIGLLQNPAFQTVKKIGISFDGGTRQTFEAIRAGISYDRLIENIQIFRQQNPDIHVFFVVTLCRANLNEVPRIAQLAAELKLFAVTFHAMHATSPELRDLVIGAEDVLEFQRLLNDVKNELKDSGVLFFDYVVKPNGQSDVPKLSHEEAVSRFANYEVEFDPEKRSLDETIELLNKQKIPAEPVDTVILRSPLRQTWASEAIPRREASKDMYSPDRIQTLRQHLSSLKAEITEGGIKNLQIPFCMAPWYRLMVNSSGGFKPCVSFNKTYASLRELSSFDEAWNGSFQTNLRQAFQGNGEITGRCKGCTLLERFQGMNDLLHFLREMDISYEELPKHPGFNPPQGQLEI